MPSFIGWLDYSEADRRQMRELLSMFETPGTVDDLGIGTLRDSISNKLFPGTSIIQTRARYFLFIPWIFQRAEERHPTSVVGKAEDMERRLIDAIRKSDDLDGLIGRQAGKDVRNLPSTIYWTGLSEYGIFLHPGLSRSQYGRRIARGTRRPADVEDELVERSDSSWQRSIPEPPERFFHFEKADFRLSRPEAEWLSEQVLSSEQLRGPTLLGSYVRALRARPVAPVGMFWEAPLPPDVTTATGLLVQHAQRFSALVQGSALVYNLMLAQTRDRDGDDQLAHARRSNLRIWADEATALDLPSWANDLDGFWQAIYGSGGRARSSARDFTTAWAELIATCKLKELADNAKARDLIRTREIQHKRAQARFANNARLQAWNGASGLDRLEFRWGQVQRFLEDLAAGLSNVEENASVGN